MKHIIHDGAMYAIISDENSVIAYSTRRLQFEPKEWQIVFRSNLREELRKLSAGTGDGIVAEYGSCITNDFVDTENALFYNIGAGAFRRAAHHGLSFNRISTEETRSNISKYSDNEYQHYYSYRIEPINVNQKYAVAEWDPITISPVRGTHKPYEYWRALRMNKLAVHIHEDKQINDNYRLDIIIQSPESQHRTINIAGIMKPIIDGVDCAFHSMPRGLPDGLSEVASRLHCSQELLVDKSNTVFGERNFVRKYQNSVQWDAADENCTECNITVQYNMSEWTFSGTISRP
jgi:hypothetical protein